MSFVYVISLFCLLISFLLYKKSNKVLSIINWLVYSVCLLFCYNTVVVYFVSLLNLGGSLLSYGIINYIVSLVLFIVTIKKKQVQKYKLDKKELILSLIIVLIVSLIGYIRFDGLNSINYESSDPATHYRHAKFFSRELEMLDKVNSKDEMYYSFGTAMSMYYINTGFLFKVLSSIKSYKVFLFFEIFCFGIYTLLFTNTLFKLFEKKEKKYFYITILTLLYTLAFPLNNMLFGFCYMGMGVMVVNLLYLTMLNIGDEINNNIIYNLLVLFMINFSLFFSYYLYMPPVYLALGIYYIYLWIKKKLDMKKVFLYVVFTLIFPFAFGFLRYMLPEFVDNYSWNSFTYVKLWGYIYDNFTPVIMLLVMFIYLIYLKIKRQVKFNFFNLSLYFITIYTVLFLYLYVFKFSEIYYFYKLFYLYWVFVIILLSEKLFNKKKVVYIVFALIIVSMITIMFNPDSNLSKKLSKFNIYNWNAVALGSNEVRFNESEIELKEESLKYKDICLYKEEFILISSPQKPKWYYSITDIIPIYNHKTYESYMLDKNTISFTYWNYIEHPCAIYYFDDMVMNDYDEEKLDEYDILFENEEGVILKKK